MGQKRPQAVKPAVFVFAYSSRFEGVHLYEGDVIPSLIALSGYEQLFLDAEKYRIIQQALAERLYRELHGDSK